MGSESREELEKAITEYIDYYTNDRDREDLETNGIS